ncbi:MAG: type VI secretion system membrane subunit TssM [Myxococcota bacterium]
MLKYLIATIVTIATWLGWWLLDQPALWIPITITVLTILVVVGILVYARMQAAKAARELEGALSLQASQQMEAARPDLQPELDEIRAEFEKAVGALKSSKLGRGRRDALYVLPWYLIIGPPGSGKTTALRNSGLEFPHLAGGNRGVRGIGGTRNCDWWLTNEAVLLDTAGRWSTQEEDHDEWIGFLELLRKYRKRKPLNGIIVTLSIVELAEASNEQLTEIAKRMRERIDESMAELKMALPVYVLFTKCDLMSGFVESFGTLSKDERSVVWGFTVPLKEGGNPGEVFERHFEELVQSLQSFCVGRLDEERQLDKRHKVFGFPQQLGELNRCFSDFINQLFAENVFSDTPMMRGAYLASGTQEGRPFDLILQRLAGAYNLQSLAQQEHQVEPKGYFLRDLFRKVIFPDRDLALRSSAEQTRQKRLYYGAVASVFLLAGLCLTLPAISCVGNRRMINEVAERGEALASEVQKAKGAMLTPDAYMPMVSELSRLWLEDDEGAPVKMRSGLYQGDDVLEAASELYGNVFQTNVVQPLFDEQTAHMADFGRTYEEARNAIPTGVEYVENLDRLRLHLLLTSPKDEDEPPLTEEEIADSLANAIAARWADAKGLEAPDDDEVSESKEAALAYVRILAGDDDLGFRRERGVVKRARGGLSRVSGIDLVLDGVVRRYQRAGPEITVRRIVGSGVPALRGRRTVRPAFTKRVWDDKLRDLFSGEAEGLVGDMWILGEYATQTATDTDVDEATYLKQLQSRYFERYIDEWREFIRGIQIETPMGTTEAIGTLQDLTRGRPTALGRVFVEINRNVDLRKKNPLLDKAGEVVDDAVDKAGLDDRDDNYLSVADVYDEFAGFVRFGVSEDPEEEGAAPQATALDVYDEQLLYLRNALQAKIDDPSSGGLSRDIQVARTEVSGLINEQDVGWRPTFEEILWPPIEGASTTYTFALAAIAGRAWCNGVSEPYRSSFRGHYPFRAAAEEAPLADFAEFYRPNGGILWQFYADHLQARIPRRGDSFEFATELGMPASQVHTQSLRRFLKRSWQISQSLFPAGAADPRINFEVRIRPSPTVAEQSLSIGGKAIRYYNGPEQWTRMTWPGESPSTGAAISIRGSNMQETIRREGGWGLFRLIEEGSVKRIDSRTFTVVWRLRSHNVDVQIDFRTARSDSPFYAVDNRKALELFRGADAEAPREIVTGRSFCGG